MRVYGSVHPCQRALASWSRLQRLSSRGVSTLHMVNETESSEGRADHSLEQAEHVSSGRSGNNLLSRDDYRLSHAFAHPVIPESQLHQVEAVGHTPQNMSDRIAKAVLQMVRRSFDIATRYKHPPPGEEENPKYALTKGQWLRRFVFLESIAGVPGMVGGMVRHLHSLRLMRRDRAWIETLLEEAYNERMHLLTFMALTKPSWMMRAMVLIAQGVFFNGFFITYLMFPRICHRFVGYLEEEAVVTYSRCINDMERGMLPEFASTPAPEIAIKYWSMKPDATVKDLIYYVRADESKHREVNHTLGNLKQSIDPNPYELDYSDLPKDVPRPTKDLTFSSTHPVGWQRNEIEY